MNTRISKKTLKKVVRTAFEESGEHTIFDAQPVWDGIFFRIFGEPPQTSGSDPHGYEDPRWDTLLLTQGAIAIASDWRNEKELERKRAA